MTPTRTRKLLKVYGSVEAVWRELDARAQNVLGEKVYQELSERRDSRVVERKKYGRAKARRSFQFSKR